MPSFNICIGLLFLCLLGLTTNISSEPLSYYRADLNLLRSNLSSNTTTPDTGFYYSTAGRNPNIVYGLFLCRGDVTIDKCHDCVTTASKEILQVCPKQSMAIVWYDECLLRYSNSYIFSSMDTSVREVMPNETNIVTEAEPFREVLASTMNELATRAASDGSGKKFAAKEANFTACAVHTGPVC